MDTAIGEEVAMASIVVRDLTGNLVFWSSEKIQSTDPLFTEAMTMFLAISTASSSFSSCCCWFEGDVKVVVDSLLSSSTILYWHIVSSLKIVVPSLGCYPFGMSFTHFVQGLCLPIMMLDGVF